MMQRIIDAHCHLFHKGYLNRRILFTLINLMADIEKITNTSKKKDFHSINITSTIKRTIQVINLINSASGEDVLNKLEKNYNGYEVIFTPLSYDLISCFQENYNIAPEKLMLRKENDYLENIKKQIIFYLDKHIHILDRLKLTSLLLNTYNKIEDLLDKEKNNIFQKEKNIFSNSNIFLYQLNELVKLKEKYPDKIYPFLYIDPRRMKYLPDYKELVGKDKIFLGIKLYTPNGYSPLDPTLMDIFAYCEKESIPITAHNAYGGFSNFVKKLQIKGAFYNNGKIEYHNGWIEFETDFFSSPGEAIKERADKLNHPQLWAEVLKVFPNLKLNLAHFGGDGLHWQTEIFKLLISYPNVYTDLSCQTELTMLNHIHKQYFSKLKEKFLYGSDYYLNMFFIDDFGKYLNNFLQVFSTEEQKIIMLQNPQKFLFDELKADLIA